MRIERGAKRVRGRRRELGIGPRAQELEGRTLLATFLVSNTGDSGPGTLRQAILDANASGGADVIAFAIPGDGPHPIVPTSPLPTVSGPVAIDGYTQAGARSNSQAQGSDAVLNVVLDGRAAGGASGLSVADTGAIIRGLVIQNFGGAGIVLEGSGHRVVGNFIGSDASGTASQGNAAGVAISRADANTIGGTAPADRNLISGNRGDGISLVGLRTGRVTSDPATSNLIAGNLIGADRTGAGPLANGGDGVNSNEYVAGNSIGGSVVGAGNIIAFNGRAGIKGGGVFSSNSIFANGGLGIDLDGDGPDRLDRTPVKYPVLGGFDSLPGGTRVRGVLLADPPLVLPADPPVTRRLEFFADAGDPSGFGEGRTFLGAAEVTPSETEDTPFEIFLPANLPNGAVLSATATIPGQGTSEFSPTRTDLSVLQVSLSSASRFAFVGSEFEITASVKNSGPFAASNVSLRVALNLGPDAQAITLISVTPSRGVATQAGDPGAVAVSIGSLDVGETATVVIRAILNRPPFPYFPSQLPIEAMASADRTELFGPLTARQSLLINPYDLAIEVGEVPPEIRIGQRASIPVLITNNGPTAAPAAQLVLSGLYFNPGFRLVSITNQGQEIALGNVGIQTECPLGRIEPGASINLVVTIEAISAGQGQSLSFSVSDFENGNDTNRDNNTRVLISRVLPNNGPTIVGFRRVGFHLRPTRLVLTLDAPLDPASAADPGNYILTGRGADGRFGTGDDMHFRLRAAYDPAANTVTLTPRRRLSLRRPYRLAIRDTGVFGLMDPFGNRIDGDRDGKPGGAYMARFIGFKKVVVGQDPHRTQGGAGNQ